MRRALAIHTAGQWPRDRRVDRAVLAWDDRHRRRIRLVGEGGTAVLLDLAEARVLADGDGLELEDGGYFEIVAAAEKLIEITAADGHALARLAWHIGNRHLAAEILEDRILIRDDHVIADMLEGLGARLRRVERPFRPESGAYAGRHDHGHDHDH
ncbi:MAG: urease accessory protein UreE [Alphaproteobacteria bacterium]|nr:urease accessory protein UreE [Alphaproteobacteria bacterium]